MSRISRRAQSVPSFHVMDLLARARRAEAAGRDIVHMEIGEPDFPAPAPVLAAGQAALAAGLTHYSPAAGLPALREAVAEHYRHQYSLGLDPARVLVTPGGSGALQLVLAALLDPGDSLLVPDPAYPCNRHIATAYGIETLALPVEAAAAYQPSVEQVRSAWTGKTRALLLGSPGNPCGSLLSLEQLRALSACVAERGGWLVVDEIYHGLTYGTEAASALQADDRCIVINSFSKYFGMTGFRVGWVVAPLALVHVLERLAQNLFLATGTPAQHAALAAFLPETRLILEERRQRFRERRDWLLPQLRVLEFGIPRVPEGAFYLYTDASRHTADSLAFALQLLEQTGVVVTPGVDFGSHRAATHLRFAYTTSPERLAEGVDRLRRFLGRGG